MRRLTYRLQDRLSKLFDVAAQFTPGALQPGSGSGLGLASEFDDGTALVNLTVIICFFSLQYRGESLKLTGVSLTSFPQAKVLVAK